MFLSIDQTFSLESMKLLEQTAKPTELAIIQGADIIGPRNNIATKYWTISPSASESGHVQCCGHDTTLVNPTARYVCARPVLLPAVTSKIPESDINVMYKFKNTWIAEYGNYPQRALGSAESLGLDQAVECKRAKPTGEKYTFNAYSINRNDVKLRDHTEYSYNGRLYTRVRGATDNRYNQLLDGRRVMEYEPYWIEVLPVQ